jgi:hypothetical protein
MTTMYQRHAQHARGASQQAQHFAPKPPKRESFDWLTWALLGAAAAVLAALAAIVSIQRSNFAAALEAEASQQTLSAITRAERDGYERAIAEFIPVAHAAWKSGLVEGARTCGRMN